MTHKCVGKLTIIGSENGLSPSRRQAIIWTDAGLLSIGPLWTYFSEILIKIQQFSLKKMHLKMSSAKRRLYCLDPNVLNSFFLSQKYFPQEVLTSNSRRISSWCCSTGSVFNSCRREEQIHICKLNSLAPRDFNKILEKLECAASNGNRYPPYPQVMATAISQ